MANYERKKTVDGLTFRLYRGEGAALLAFDLERAKATDDFVGFSVEVKDPGSNNWGALRNRLHFDYPPNPKRPLSFKSTEAPFQKFRWVHVPTDVSGAGEFRYRVTALYMDTTGKLHSGAAVEESISLRPETIAGFVNVAFTRGFASSQAYADRFNNETGILPPVNAPAKASLSHDMTPFPKQYDWLGFEVRRLIYQLLDEVIADPSQKLDALIYECKEPEILKRLEKLGPRLRAVIDDHADQGEPDSCETISADRLTAAGAQVKRMHFARNNTTRC